MLRHNVIGALRTARTFIPLLRNKKGRLINLGMNNNITSGLVAYTAARYAVEGASLALRQEIAPYGIHIITLQPNGIHSEEKYLLKQKNMSVDLIKSDDHTALEIQQPANRYLEYNLSVLPAQSMRMIEEALLSKSPKQNYKLTPDGKINLFNHTAVLVRNKIFHSKLQVS
ncbi:hypothetical protein L9F63_010135 [Diploptera punctata]|uniref:Uncharacterized protein n=1 Tax=Diploptera punctata TaxID=6984 RepID=A0AAD8AHP9_DIPPU|nr:hypothetical protein L9F63_010135 [Diploptera punctata]